jgi:hypothetical protein
VVRLGTVLAFAGLALIVCGLVVLTVEVRRGETGFGQLRGESRETRRAVRRAILDGGTDDPDVDRLARRALGRAPNGRGMLYLFGTLLVIALLLLLFVGPYTPGRIALRCCQVLLWSGAIALNLVNRRRLLNYRGLRP